MKKIILAASALLILGGGAWGQALSSETVDYGKLSIDNLPPIQVVVKEAAKFSTSGNLDIKAETEKIYRSNLVPLFRVQAGSYARPHYEYGVSDYSRDFEFTDIDENVLPGSYNGVDQTYGPQSMGSESYLTWNVMAKWNLSKLVMDREELYLIETKARASFYQKNTMDNVVGVYRNLRGLLVEKIQYKDDPALGRDVMAAAVELDFLTGGFLTQVIGDLKRPLSGVNAIDGEAKSVEWISVEKDESRGEKAEKSDVDPTRDPRSPLYELDGGGLSDAPADGISGDAD